MPDLEDLYLDGYSIEWWIAWYHSQSNDPGNVVSGYSSGSKVNTLVQKENVKVGVTLGFYDPVVSALLAGEI